MAADLNFDDLPDEPTAGASAKTAAPSAKADLNFDALPAEGFWSRLGATFAPPPGSFTSREPGDMPTMNETLGITGTPQAGGRKDREEPGFWRPDAETRVKSYLDNASFGLSSKALGNLDQQPLTPGAAPSYAGGVAAQRKELADWQKANPGAAMETAALGFATPGLGMAKGVKAAITAARYTPSLIAKMLMAGGGATLFNAGQEAGHTEGTLEDYANALKKGAAEPMTIPTPWGEVSSKVPTPWGEVTIPAGVVAGAFPLLGKAAGSAASFLSPYFQKAAPGMGRTATGVMQDVLPFNAPQRLEELGPQATLADVGPAPLAKLRGVTQRSMGTPLQADIENSYAERAKGQSSRLLGDLDTNYDTAIHPDEAVGRLAAKRAEIGNELPAIFENGPRSIDTSEPLRVVGEGINNAATLGPEKSVLDKARKLLMEPMDIPKGDGTTYTKMVPITDPVKLDKAKTVLDQEINYTNREYPGAINQKSGAAAQVRNAINQSLREQVPGYGDVMDRLSTLHRGEEGVRYGETVLTRGKDMPWPEQLNQKLDTTEPTTPGYTTAVRTGARGSLQHAVGTNPNDLVAIKRMLGGENDFSRDNASRLFGEQPTQNMLNSVDREQTFTNTNDNLSSVRGSKTAGSLSAGSAAEPPSRFPLNTTSLGLAGRVLQNIGTGIYDHLRGMQRGAMTEQVGRGLSTPPSQALVNALMQGKGAAERARQGAYNAVTNPGMAAALLGYGDNRR